MVRPAAAVYPRSAIVGAARCADHPHMEVITPSRSDPRRPIVPALGAALLWTSLLVSGIVLACVVFATPVLGWLTPPGRPDTSEMVRGMVLWAIALVGPAGLILLGANRLARILGAVRARAPRRSLIQRSLASLPEGVVLARGLTLPDGRGVSDLLVGPFGAAVLRELPPSEVTRIRQGRWELRTRRGWVQLQDPLQRAERDAERVRRWLGDDDTDFVIRMYSAVVGLTPTIDRTPACAVLTPDQLATWVAALPAQRSLTQSRRDRLLEVVRSAAI
jgi:hypothetical protein